MLCAAPIADEAGDLSNHLSGNRFPRENWTIDKHAAHARPDGAESVADIAVTELGGQGLRKHAPDVGNGGIPWMQLAV
ncbi:hypothetical protein WHT83_08835 [Aminobacter sp. P9b]|uniref:Uncharacterized protein n=1 Tax=Aminobacter niigataensis TaxID=83265 RepID=A0ABR6L990_9HYPH|nr:hypothetical protein [Aminobacter niigataensis]MBB4652501.1 hypothetical protein [Aminobacter niigataensis]